MFLGKVQRYYPKTENGKTIETLISDKEWEAAGTAANTTYEDWYWYDADSKINYGQAPKWVCEVIAPILNVLNSILIPVIVILGVAGMIYGIVLGVQYSKAETADKREELKKRLISAVIGIGIALVVLIVMKVLIQNAGKIFGWVEDESGTGTGTGNGTGGGATGGGNAGGATGGGNTNNQVKQ